MLCPNCGKEVPDRSKFCPYCGTEITSTKKRKHSNLKIILPIMIVMVLLSSFAVYQVIKTQIGERGENNNQQVATEQEIPALIPYRKGD